MAIEILITALIAALTQLVLHWFPWRMVLRRDLPRTMAYVLGVLGFSGPLTGLLWMWGLVAAIGALWAVIAASGLAVLGAYRADAIMMRFIQGAEAEERNEARSAKR